MTKTTASKSTNSTASDAELDVRPISGALGAEIRGVDLSDLDDDTWAHIHDLWLEHLVVFPERHRRP